MGRNRKYHFDQMTLGEPMAVVYVQHSIVLTYTALLTSTTLAIWLSDGRPREVHAALAEAVRTFVSSPSTARSTT